MTNPTVGDLTARLRFYYSDDPLDFKKTGKGVVIVEDGVADVPLPSGPPGPPGRLSETDRLSVLRAIATVEELDESIRDIMQAHIEVTAHATTVTAKAKEAEESRKAADEAKKSAQSSANTAKTERETTESESEAAQTSRVASERAQEIAEMVAAVSATGLELVGQHLGEADSAADRAELAIENTRWEGDRLIVMGQESPPLRGPAMTWADLTPEQIESLRGLPGKRGAPFSFEDFTPEQLEDLRVPAGTVENVQWSDVQGRPDVPKIQLVDALPTSPDPSTIYLVRGA